MTTKVIEIKSEYIKFDNNYRLLSEHEQDCCENHYLSFNNLRLDDFDNLEFNLEDDNFFTKIVDYGIQLNPIKGFSVRIPGYGSNNGYYSSDLTLILTNGTVNKTFDISDCQVISD